MAAVLTDELTRVSVASIEKWDEGPDGTVYVYGRCTTPEVDTDEQVVDSGWSGPALKTYLAEAPTVRVQHNAQRDPAGSAVRVDVNRDGDGAHWLKAAVDEPVAQRLVKRGHLRAFSVGISRPVIERDMSGKARGGIIKGGKIVEVSLVDSPANRSCFLEIAKSAADGTPEFTGKMVADDDVIEKALGDDLLTKDAADTWSAPAPGPVDISNFQMPQDLNVTFTPDDMMRLMQQKFVSQHYDELAVKAVIEAETGVYKRDIDTATRRRLAADGKALPNLSYPIENAGDLGNAATLARSGHGDVAAARRLISRRARELGVANPLDESDAEKSETVEAPVETPAVPVAEKADVPEVVKEAEPDVTKDPEDAPAEPKAKPVKKAKKPKKMPPWLNKPKDGDDDGDSGSDAKDDDSCKSAHVWEIADQATGTVECAKCHTTPAQAAGVAGVHDMTCAPVPELMESDGPACTKGATPASASGAVGETMQPVARHREPDGAPMEAFEADSGMSDGDNEKPTRLEAATGMKAATASSDLAPDPEVAALLRFKATGTDEDLGRLHDLTCPAFHPEQVAKYHPYAEMGSLIDAGAWQRKTLAAAAGPLEAAREMQDVWQAANLLKAADPADLNQWRLELHKAFRDANPGPGSFPTPGCVSPGSYNRPVLTDGRSANAVDYDGPNSSPQVATSPPNAQHFDRPPLSAGQESPSPSFMKASFEYPAEQGRPTQLNYAAMQKEQARQALVRMHHHLARQFPEACPITLDTTPPQQENHPVPAAAGIGKAEDLVPAPNLLEQGTFKAEPEQQDIFADADVYKGFKKMRKKLGKKVLSGSMTVDEARAKLGRQFAQKSAEPPAEAVQKAAPSPVTFTSGGGGNATITYVTPGVTTSGIVGAPPVAASFSPENIEAAVTKAVAPLLEKIQAQDTELAETKRVIDAIADQPDPSTAAFSGLAFQPQIVKSRRPAAVPDQAEYAARAQEMVRRNLTHTYQTHSDPHVREAASSALANLGVGMEAPPMT